MGEIAWFSHIYDIEHCRWVPKTLRPPHHRGFGTWRAELGSDGCEGGEVEAYLEDLWESIADSRNALAESLSQKSPSAKKVRRQLLSDLRFQNGELAAATEEAFRPHVKQPRFAASAPKQLPADAYHSPRTLWKGERDMLSQSCSLVNYASPEKVPEPGFIHDWSKTSSAANVASFASSIPIEVEATSMCGPSSWAVAGVESPASLPRGS